VNNPDNDRDTTIDHLLASTIMRNARTDSAGACLDAETLAAWADDGLDRQERTAVETHAAGCERCQAMMASLARAEHAHDAVTAVSKPVRRFPALAWLIPLTAVAAALIVWIAVPQRGPTAVHEDPAQAVNSVAVPAIPAGAASAPPEAATPSTEPKAAAGSSPRRELGRSQPADSNTLTDRTDPLAKQRSDLRAKDEPRADQDAAPTSSAAADALARSNSVTTNEAMTEKRAAAPAAAPSALAAPAEPSGARSAATAKAFAGATAGASGITIVSSNPVSRWRIVPGGAVQHTADGGSTWQTQQTGATVTLAAGSSPSPSVCWLVGPEGTVLLSTDGRTWRRIAFVEQADLVGVAATDEKTATVSFADGRTLTTTDAGVSWQR
jgi:hypothetical protein